VRLHLNGEKAEHGGVCLSSYQGRKHKRIGIQASLSKKQNPISKNNHSKKGWRRNSTDRVPAEKKTAVLPKKEKTGGEGGGGESISLTMAQHLQIAH
jgi:hypothetical protein